MFRMIAEYMLKKREQKQIESHVESIFRQPKIAPLPDFSGIKSPFPVEITKPDEASIAIDDLHKNLIVASSIANFNRK